MMFNDDMLSHACTCEDGQLGKLDWWPSGLTASYTDTLASADIKAASLRRCI